MRTTLLRRDDVALPLICSVLAATDETHRVRLDDDATRQLDVK